MCSMSLERMWQSSKGEYCSDCVECWLKLLLLLLLCCCVVVCIYTTPIEWYKCTLSLCVACCALFIRVVETNAYASPTKRKSNCIYCLMCVFYFVSMSREYHFDWSCTCSDLMACLFYCTFQAMCVVVRIKTHRRQWKYIAMNIFQIQIVYSATLRVKSPASFKSIRVLDTFFFLFLSRFSFSSLSLSANDVVASIFRSFSIMHSSTILSK